MSEKICGNCRRIRREMKGEVVKRFMCSMFGCAVKQDAAPRRPGCHEFGINAVIPEWPTTTKPNDHGGGVG